MDNEMRAARIGNDRKLLLRRLLESLHVLTPELRKQFGKWRYDFIGARLIGENGLYLQWATRPKPGEPIGYDNQQTNRGTVHLLRF